PNARAGDARPRSCISAFGRRVLRRALRRNRRRRQARAVVLADDVDMTAGAEEIRLRTVEDDGHLHAPVRPVDVPHAEAEPARAVRVARDRREHETADAELAPVA